MITPTRGVSGLASVAEIPGAGQGVPRPAAAAPGLRGARVLAGAPRPMNGPRPNGDPSSLTLWGSEDWDRE